MNRLPADEWYQVLFVLRKVVQFEKVVRLKWVFCQKYSVFFKVDRAELNIIY